MTDTPSKKSGSGGRSREDVEKLLSDLDNLGEVPPASSSSSNSGAGATSGAGAGTGVGGDKSKTEARPDAQSLLDDLDSLVQRRAPSRGSERGDKGSSATVAAKSAPPAEASAPAPPAVTTPLAAPGPSPATSAAQAVESAPAPEAEAKAQAPGAGWGGWGSMWNQATSVINQARAEIEKRAESEQAKELQARGWGLAQGVRGFVKDAGLEKLGQDLTTAGRRGWTDIINAVAPPIAAHEVIQVTLSHDMIGYDGIEDVVFRVLAKVMEQVDNNTEQQLVVNKAPDEKNATRPKEGEGRDRDINAIEGFEAAYKLAEVNLDQLIKTHTPPAPVSSQSNVTVPVTTCPVFVRIQPCLAALPWFASTGSFSKARIGEKEAASGSDKEHKDKELHLFFMIMLQDPSHGLSHRTMSQAVPKAWMDVPFEENAWVEDSLVNVLRGALSVVGQDYVNGRMTGRSRSLAGEAVGVTPVSSIEAQTEGPQKS